MPLRTKTANRKDINTARNGVELQHRHFSFIAGVIAAMPDHAASLRAQKVSVAMAFAEACERTNDKFDRGRFLAACQASRLQPLDESGQSAGFEVL